MILTKDLLDDLLNLENNIHSLTLVQNPNNLQIESFLRNLEKRKEEISKLDHEILTLKKQYNSLQNMTPYLNDAFNALNNEELWLLPEPNKLTLASTYHKNIVQPKFSKLRAFIQPLINQVFDIVKELINLKTQLIFLKSENTELKNSIDELSYENRELKRDMNKLKKFFGKDTIENALTFKIVKSKRKEIHK